MIDQTLYKYLKEEWKYRNHPKYLHYFEECVDNLTENQIHYFTTLWFKL